MVFLLCTQIPVQLKTKWGNLDIDLQDLPNLIIVKTSYCTTLTPPFSIFQYSISCISHSRFYKQKNPQTLDIHPIQTFSMNDHCCLSTYFMKKD